MTKKILSALLVLGMVASLAACGASDDESGDASEQVDSSSASEDVKLTWLLADDLIDGSANSKIAAKYEEETGVEIEVQEVPYDDIKTKLVMMIRGGNAPSLVRATGLAEFSDFVLPIDDAVDRNVILDSRLDACLVNDQLIAIPSSLTANGMFYNKTAFDQAGVVAPTGEDDLWTWDEFVENVQTVVDNSDVDYGLVWDHSQHRYSTLMYQFGGSMYNEDLTTTRVANEKSLNALNFFVSLFDQGIIPASSWVGGEDPAAMFKTGKVAVHFSGSWKVADYYENITDFEWGALTMPYEETRSSLPGGTFIFGVDGTGVEQETKDFISWLYSPEIYTEYCEYGQFLPGQKDIEPEYVSDASNVFIDELEATPRIAGISMTIENKYPGTNYGNAYRDYIDLAVLGELTTEQALEETEKAVLEAYPELESER